MIAIAKAILPMRFKPLTSALVAILAAFWANVSWFVAAVSVSSETAAPLASLANFWAAADELPKHL